MHKAVCAVRVAAPFLILDKTEIWINIPKELLVVFREDVINKFNFIFGKTQQIFRDSILTVMSI